VVGVVVLGRIWFGFCWFWVVVDCGNSAGLLVSTGSLRSLGWFILFGVGL